MDLFSDPRQKARQVYAFFLISSYFRILTRSQRQYMVELSPDIFSSLGQRQNLVPDPPAVTTHSAAAIHTSELFAVVPTGGKA